MTSGEGPHESRPSWALGDWILPPTAWSDELRDRLQLTRQGFIVESPPLVYYGHANPPLTATTTSWATARGRSSGPVAPADRPPFGLIVTQTCDLVEEGKPKRPWLDIAPVYVHHCTPAESARIARGDMFAYFVPVTALDTPPDGLWVADLRLVSPVEKSWLLSVAAPVTAFADERSQRLFWLKVSRWGRPAEPRAVRERFVEPVARLALELRAAYGEAAISEIRYQSGRDRGDPDFLRAVFLAEDAVPAPVQTAIEERWAATYDTSLVTDGIEILPPLFETFRSIDPRMYESMTRIPLDEHGGTAT